MHYDRFSWLDAPNLHSNLYICTMQMSLAWRHQAKFGDSVIKYLKQLEDVAHEKNIFIYQNERKIDMRMTSDQMEQSPLDPENVRSLKHTGSGSGVSRFQTVHFFPFIMYLYRVTRILCQLDHACTCIKTRIKNDSAHYLDDC